MTVYAFPALTPNVSAWALKSNVAVFEAFNNAISTLNRGGERWEIELSFLNLRGADRATLRAWLVQLNGQEHRFTVHDHSHTQRGTFGGTPVVDGSSQTGTQINIRGATASVTNWIRAGDWLQFGNELKQCTADANTDGSGDVAVSFLPRIRTSPADGAAIEVVQPLGQFLLNSNRTSWRNKPGGFSDFVISAIEDITA